MDGSERMVAYQLGRVKRLSGEESQQIVANCLAFLGLDP